MFSTKFRYFNQETNEMIYSEEESFLSHFFIGYEACEKAILMESTKHTDVYHHDIYDGDLLKTENYSRILEVYYCSTRKKHLLRMLGKRGLDNIKLDVTIEHQRVEIVGNIYEHPELLPVEVKKTETASFEWDIESCDQDIQEMGEALFLIAFELGKDREIQEFVEYMSQKVGAKADWHFQNSDKIVIKTMPADVEKFYDIVKDITNHYIKTRYGIHIIKRLIPVKS